MRMFGLLGFPLGHSFSKAYFTSKFQRENIRDCRYENFAFEKIDDAIRYLKELPDLAGFNITIPHKRNIIESLDVASGVCREIGSCNTVKVADGRWLGYNSDVVGFSKSLVPLLTEVHTKALVFGSGGASKSVAYVLKQLGISYKLVSRTPTPETWSYESLTTDIIASHTLLINTTPVGQFPHTDECIHIPYEGISSHHLAYDLIYNPSETLFLKKAGERGSTTKNGEEMLVLQAEESWRIWNTPEPE